MRVFAEYCWRNNVNVVAAVVAVAPGVDTIKGTTIMAAAATVGEGHMITEVVVVVMTIVHRTDTKNMMMKLLWSLLLLPFYIH